MRDYIPTIDAERVNWLMELALWLEANGLARGREVTGPAG